MANLPKGWMMTETDTGMFVAQTKRFGGITLEGDTRDEVVDSANRVNKFLGSVEGDETTPEDSPSG